MRKTDDGRQVRGECGALCRGRAPVASARIEGTEECPTARGGLSLYATPAGTVVFAEMRGMPRGAVWRLCLAREGGESGSVSCFPLLYEREGEAWFCDLTEKLSPMTEGERTVCLTRASSRGREETVVASGTLRYRQTKCG